MLPLQRHISQLKHKKFLSLTCLTKGSRILEKNMNETQVSKTVFSHHNAPSCKMQDGGRTHTRVLRKFLCCFMVSDLLLTINHLQVDGEGYRKCEEAGGGI